MIPGRGKPHHWTRCSMKKVLPVVSGFIMLTRLDGSPVWINKDMTVYVSYSPSCKSTGVLTLNALQCVKETPEEVMEKMK